MKPAVLVLVLLAAAIGAYLAFGTGNDAGESDPMPVAPSGPPAATKDDPESKKGAVLTAKKDPSKVTQVPQQLDLQVPANALMIARGLNTWTKTVELACQSLKGLGFSTWYLEQADGGPSGGAHRGIPALQDKPTADYLERNDVRALLFDSADPNVFPAEFWETVARRVRSGKMGLYVRPGYPPPPTPGEKSPAVHPVLTHPVLKDLLPILRTKPVSGTPLPGTFPTEPQPVRVTTEGTTHPATRYVEDRESSLHAWASAGYGEGAFATMFCYPVEEIREGAMRLADVVAAVDHAAIIATAPGGPRVLWMGNIDFGRKVHYHAEQNKLQNLLLNHWLVWLVGQRE